jgi:hypothetical protein
VPAAATAYTGADAALSVTLQEGASGSLGALATKVAATSLSPIPQGGISLFHVGIGPFIAASIAMSVLTATVPSLKELTKDAGRAAHGEAVHAVHHTRGRGRAELHHRC